jgi:hypothetical protein
LQLFAKPKSKGYLLSVIRDKSPASLGAVSLARDRDRKDKKFLHELGMQTSPDTSSKIDKDM